MTLTFAKLLAAAWQLFRRERALLVAVAAPLIFLPAFAALLLGDPVPPLPPPPRDQAMMQAWIEAMTIWGRGNALIFLLADVAGIYGAAVIALLLLDPERPTVAQALRGAGGRLLPFVLASMAAAIPVGLGLWLFVLPGLYAQARLACTLPLMARRPSLGAWTALRASWVVTRGHGRALTGALVALFLAQWLAVVPLLSLDEWVRAPGNESPLALALVDGAITALSTAWHVAALLVGIVFYRVRARSGT